MSTVICFFIVFNEQPHSKDDFKFAFKEKAALGCALLTVSGDKVMNLMGQGKSPQDYATKEKVTISVTAQHMCYTDMHVCYCHVRAHL